MLSTPREQAQRSLSISKRRLTDFHLAFDSGLAAVAVVDLRLVVRVHHFYKFTWYRRILEDRSSEKKTQHSSNRTNQQRYVIRQYWEYDMEHVTSLGESDARAHGTRDVLGSRMRAHRTTRLRLLLASPWTRSDRLRPQPGVSHLKMSWTLSTVTQLEKLWRVESVPLVSISLPDDLSPMSPSQSYFSVTACHPRISLSLHVTVPHISLSLHVTVPHISLTTCHSAPTSLCHYMSQCPTSLCHYMSQCPTPLSLHVTVPHISLSLHVTVPHTSLTTCHSAPHLSYYITMSSLPPFSPKHDSVAWKNGTALIYDCSTRKQFLAQDVNEEATTHTSKKQQLQGPCASTHGRLVHPHPREIPAPTGDSSTSTHGRLVHPDPRETRAPAPGPLLLHTLLTCRHS